MNKLDVQNAILNAMTPYLDDDQLYQLKNTLIEQLYGMNIVEEETRLSVGKRTKICVKKNENLCQKFCAATTTLQRVVYEENKIELLKKYLNNDWYNEDCGCYEAHKSKQNIYYGYWSFEAGAIAKILKINDTQLRDTQYYPYDMVHYKE